MTKISEFLKGIGSHQIYHEPQLSEDFEKQTGFKAVWPTHSVGSTNCSLGEIMGVVRELKGSESARCSYGYQIAASLEEEYASSTEWAKYIGRGSSFRASVSALEKAGK